MDFIKKNVDTSTYTLITKKRKESEDTCEKKLNSLTREKKSFEIFAKVNGI